MSSVLLHRGCWRVCFLLKRLSFKVQHPQIALKIATARAIVQLICKEREKKTTRKQNKTNGFHNLCLGAVS